MASKFAAIALLLFCTACSFTRDVGDEWVMGLPASNPAEAVGTKTTKVDSLKVELPECPSYLETQRVAVKRPDTALDYYQGVRWADMLPLLLQQALVGSLQGEGIYRQVVSDEVAAPTPYRLQTQIREFYVIHDQDRPQAVMVLGYSLQKNLKTIHAGQVEGRAYLNGEDRMEIQQGLAAAYQNLVRDLSAQLASAK